MKADQLLFLHIPKTAGTSVHNILHRHFKAKAQVECNVFIHKNDPDKLPEETRRNLKLLRGHFPFGMHEQLCTGTFEYTTILREPIDRVISHYSYMKVRQAVRTKPGARIMQGTLEEVCAKGDFIFVDNLQTRFLSGETEVPIGNVTSEMMERAWKNLETCFPLVGIQEEFDAYVLMLCDRYSFRYPWYRKQRVNKQRDKVSQLDNRTRAAVAARNVHDLELYRRVKERVMREIAAKGPDFRKRIETFQKRNALLAKLMNLLPFSGRVAKATD